MKRLFALLIFLLAGAPGAEAQSTTTLRLLLPEPDKNVSEEALSSLANKLTLALSTQGIVEGNNTLFALEPKVNLLRHSAVEGLQRLVAAKFDLSLNIKNIATKTIHSSTSLTISGSGSSVTDALKNAISNINNNDPLILKFFNETNVKIQQYYHKECKNIIAKADREIGVSNFESALSLLYSIPEETPCYSDVAKKLSSTYLSYQNASCNKNIQKAKSYLALRNYADALYFLGLVDTGSKCIAEADALLKEIGSEMNDENRKQWELLLKREDNKLAVEKARAEILDKILDNYYGLR